MAVNFTSNSIKISLFSLIVVNLFAFISVITNNIFSSSLLLIYWLESIIIFGFTILKTRSIKNLGTHRSINITSKKAILVPFITKYSLYLIFYLIFLTGLIYIPMGTSVSGAELSQKISNDLTSMNKLHFTLLLFSFFISHFISYKFNFIKNKEYQNTSVLQLTQLPSQRLLIMHLAIVIGALLRAPNLLLVIIKTAFDIIGHLLERKKLGSNIILIKRF